MPNEIAKNDEGNNRVSEIGSAKVAGLFRFIKRINDSENPKFATSNRFERPFNVSSDELSQIRKTSLSLLGNVLDVNPDFDGTVRFTNLATRKYDNYESLVENSANDKEPESLYLKWSVFDVSQNGEPIAGSIKIDFVTEKQLENQEIGLGEISRANVTLTVEGSDEEWVQAAFARILPFVEATNISKIFRWMNVFRNKWYIEILRNVSGVLGMFFGMMMTSAYVRRLRHGEITEKFQEILRVDETGERLNKWIEYQLFPKDSSIFYGLAPIIVGFCLYFLVSLSALKVIPLLAPTSSLGIGLTGKFRRDSQNMIRFFIINVIVLGVILPICLSFFGLT